MSAETDLALLLETRTAILTAMRDNAGKPDYSINGQSVTWSSLGRQLADINSQIAALQGPVDLTSEGHV